MTYYKDTLLQLNKNLAILQQREAKYGGNAPLELVNQIDDHQQAIILTEQAIAGDLTEAEWCEELKPLLLACQNGQIVNIEAETYVTGNLITHIYQTPPPPLPPAEAKDRQNLGILLNKVKQFWIEGVLEKSVHNEALIDLGKETQTDAVDQPWEQVLELPDQSRQPISPGKKISNIFDEMNRALLILGEPGSGKTITLLQLAKELIAQYEADETYSQPVPVVFNLSSWTDSNQSLIDWLVLELSAKYQIPKKIGRPWLENNRILPLLDGLDEVKLENQAACVEAINQFCQEFGLAGVAVCSRIEEYTRLPVRLKLNCAIRLQPLTLEQIYTYLDGAGPKLAALRTALQTDEGLQELAQSPLVLDIMSLAYQDKPVEELSDATYTLETRRAHLFDTYIERMFKRKGSGDKPYVDEKTKDWLAWLGYQMNHHGQSDFLIERMQPSWLQTFLLQRMYIFVSRLIGGLIFGLVFGLLAGQKHILMVGLIVGVAVGASVSFLNILQLENDCKGPTKPPNTWQLVGKILLFGVIIGLICGLSVSFVSGLSLGLVGKIGVGFGYGLLGGLAGGLIFGIRGSRETLSNDIQTVETLVWSWRRAVKGLTLGLMVMLFLSLSIAIVAVLNSNVSDGLESGASLFFRNGLLFGLIGAMFGGMSNRRVKTQAEPNQGIELSLDNALSIVSVCAVLGGLVGLITSIGGLGLGLVGGLRLGLFMGLFASLWYGGLDVIQHYTLRLILWIKGHTPRNYVPFLDYCTDRIFLRKVGGGYIFIHRLLLEHFAAMYEPTQPEKINTPSDS